MRDHLVFETLMIVAVRSAGESEVEPGRPAIGRIDSERFETIAKRDVLKKCRYVYLVFAPNTGVFALERPGLQVKDERGYLGIRVLEDRTFFQRREGKLLLDMVFVQLVHEDRFIIQFCLYYLSVLQVVGDRLQPFHLFLFATLNIQGYRNRCGVECASFQYPDPPRMFVDD